MRVDDGVRAGHQHTDRTDDMNANADLRRKSEMQFTLVFVRRCVGRNASKANVLESDLMINIWLHDALRKEKTRPKRHRNGNNVVFIHRRDVRARAPAEIARRADQSKTRRQVVHVRRLRAVSRPRRLPELISRLGNFCLKSNKGLCECVLNTSAGKNCYYEEMFHRHDSASDRQVERRSNFMLSSITRRSRRSLNRTVSPTRASSRMA